MGSNHKVNSDFAWSRYSFAVAERDTIVLYNLLSGAVLAVPATYPSDRAPTDLDEKLFKHVRRFLDAPEDRDFFVSSFLTPCVIDERDVVAELYQRQRHHGSIWTVTLIPTLSCNLTCHYCYAHKSGAFMTKKVMGDLMRWLAILPSTTSLLRIVWVGGEPTLACPEMMRVTKHAQKRCRELGAEFECTLVTNGVLLTPSRMRDLVDAGIHKVQITLDGPQAIHDSTRRMAGGRGTFTIIRQNMAHIPKKVHLSIRINVMNKDSDRLLPLLDELSALPLAERAAVYFAHVARDGACAEDTGHADNLCLSGLDFAPTQLALTREASKRGLSVYLPFRDRMLCSAVGQHSVVVEPDGSLKKCWHDPGDPKTGVGMLTPDGPVFTNAALPWTQYDPFAVEECKDCTILPLCFGGCPWRVRRGRSLADRCHILKYLLPEYVKFLYDATTMWNKPYDPERGILGEASGLGPMRRSLTL
jgi:uncharacterized protein